VRFEAIRITQPSGRSVFAFPAQAEDLLKVVQISHVRRGTARELRGYQRPEVASHIAEIRRYLETSDSVLPNAIVVAFDERAQFIVERHTKTGERGVLVVPEEEIEGRLCGFVVDGQQRLAAVSSCRHGSFPFFVTAMVAATEAEQRKQFVLVNRTKPLPPGLVFELLPEIGGSLPTALARQQFAARLVMCLNLDENSSLFGIVRTPTSPDGFIKDNSIRRLVLNSLSDGALATLPADPIYDMIDVVSIYWQGVTKAFGRATTLPPSKSRLTHGVGIVSLGFVMDELYLAPRDVPWTAAYVAERLAVLVPHCAWCEGEWDFGAEERRPWNALQNIDRDIRLLTHFMRRLLR